jgi:phosphate transport system protein
MVQKIHTDREYEAELAEVRKRLLTMAGYVEAMIASSMQALSERDPELARRTIREDAKVNTAECETDMLCLRILAKRQPMASDLRFVTLAFKMVTDLERIGDLAVNICERTIDLEGSPPLGNNEDLHRMSDLVQSMVRDAIDAFVEGDAEKASGVIACDDQVDRLYEQVFVQVLDVMRLDPDAIQTGIHVQSVAKWLERMADHATNIAEQVIWMVQGRDVRHAGKLA